MAKYARGNPAKWWRTRSIGAVHRSPAAMFISPLRRYATLGLLVILVSMIGGVWYLTNSKRISRMAQLLLSDVLGGQVEVGSGRLSFSGTLELAGVNLRTSRDPHSPILFSADQVTVRFDWLSLLSGQLKATQITATRPTLNLVEDLSSQAWNYEALQPRPSAPRPPGGKPLIASLPVILLREASVQWAEINQNGYAVTGVTVVDGQFSPDAASPRLYSYTVDQRAEPDVSSAATHPAAEPGLGRVRGTWDIESNRFTASVRDVRLTEGLERSMPREVREWCQAHKLDGRLKSLLIDFDPDRGLMLKVELDKVALQQPLYEFMPNARQNVAIRFNDITGALTFQINRGVLDSIELLNLQGRVADFGFMVDGRIGARADSPFDLLLRFPNARIGETYPDLFLAFDQTQDLIRRLRPRGLFDVSVQLRRGKGEPSMAVVGDVDCKDVNARFIHFPYPMEHVRGRVHFDDEVVTFQHVAAQADENAIIIDGSVGVASDNQLIDLRVSSDGAQIDNRLARCLPPRFGPIWQLFDPHGLVKFECLVRRGKSRDDPQTIRVDVQPLDVTAQYREFPYALHHIKGRFVIEDELTVIDSLVAKAGPGDHGEVSFRGTVRYPGGDLDKVDPQIDIIARDLPLDRTLLQALPDEHDLWSDAVDITGQLAFTGSVRHDPRGGVAVTGDIRLSQAMLQPPAGAWPIRQIEARATLSPDHIELLNFQGLTGPDGQCALNVHGSINRAASVPQIAFAADWKNLALLPTPPRFLPASMASLWGQAQPRGLIDGECRMVFTFPIGPSTSPASVSTAPAAAPSLQEYQVVLRPRGVSFSPAGWPEPLDSVAGVFTVTPARVQLQDLAVETGPARLTASGGYDFAAGVLELRDLRIVSPALPEAWVKSIPSNAGQLIASLTPDGAIALDAPVFHWRAVGPDAGWDIAGRFTLDRLKTTGDVPLSAEALSFNGAAVWSAKAAGLDLDGFLSAHALGLSGKTIDTFTGRVIGRSANHTVALNGLDGRVAGGAIQGNLVVTAEAQPHYEATFVLSDAELASLILPANASPEDRRRIGTGRVTANLAVQERFGDLATRTGRGELVVRDGTVYNVPLAMGLMQLATLRLPVSRAFTNAQMSYYIRDNKVTFEKILLQSDGINLAGMGTLSLKDQELDLRFVTESSRELWFGLVDWARNQLLQLQVGGTVENPRITPVPLDALSVPLRLLLPRRRGQSD